MPDDPVLAYAYAVIAGEVPAGRLVRLACERHRRDWQLTQQPGGHPAGFTFDLATVDRALRFFACLRHSKGEWAGEPFILEPWQVFIVGALLGWKRADDTRRFRTAYVEVPRKNGKSTLLAGLGLYGLVIDREHGAEGYCAATMRDQAKIVWSEAARMRDKSPALTSHVRKFRAIHDGHPTGEVRPVIDRGPPKAAGPRSTSLRTRFCKTSGLVRALKALRAGAAHGGPFRNRHLGNLGGYAPGWLPSPQLHRLLRDALTQLGGVGVVFALLVSPLLLVFPD